MECLINRQRKRERAPAPVPQRAPFENCGICDEVGHEIVRDALVRWFGASGARRAMIGKRDVRFIDMAAVTMAGPALSCEDAYAAWAAIEVAQGATHPALVDLASRPFAREWEPLGLFRAFLREANIVLPDMEPLLVFYAVEIARGIVSRSMTPMEGAAMLAALADHPAGCAASRLSGWGCREVPGAFARLKLLAQGIEPDTYAPLFNSPDVDDRIRTEAQALIDVWSARVVTSDDPEDWRSRLT